jgi:hypothetical protein
MIESKFINKTAVETIPNIKPISDRRKAIDDMNGFFISHFFKLMYNTVDIMDTDNAFSGGSGEKIFREFLLNEYSTAMSGKFHLTNDMIERYVTPEKTSTETSIDA